MLEREACCVHPGRGRASPRQRPGESTALTTSQPFSEFLRARRQSLDLPVARFAELVGRSPSTVRGWERGRSRPGDPKTVAAIAAVLDMDEESLASLIAGGEVEVEERATEPKDSEWMAPQPVAASVATESTFFAPSTSSPIEDQPLRRMPWLPMPPRRTVIDRADRGIRYQLRVLGTILAVVVLLLVLQWALGEFRESISDLKLSVFGP